MNGNCFIKLEIKTRWRIPRWNYFMLGKTWVNSHLVWPQVRGNAVSTQWCCGARGQTWHCQSPPRGLLCSSPSAPLVSRGQEAMRYWMYWPDVNYRSSVQPLESRLTFSTLKDIVKSELTKRMFSGFRSVWVSLLSWRTRGKEDEQNFQCFIFHQICT